MNLLHRIGVRDCQRTRWKNDGGWTTEIARHDAGGGDNDSFDWRVSIAEIERNGPFSTFPGIERDLLLLEGGGIELDIGNAAPRRLSQRFERVHFDGEAPVQCRLLAGPTRDFNVMARRERWRAEVVARPLVGPMVIFPDAGTSWLVHVLAGHAEARAGAERVTLAGGDSLRIEFHARSDSRVVVDGGGELVLVKFEPVAAAETSGTTEGGSNAAL